MFCDVLSAQMFCHCSGLNTLILIW